MQKQAPLLKIVLCKTTKLIRDKVQRLACTCISQAMKMRPTEALEVITDLAPLHLTTERAAIQTTLRVSRKEQKMRESEVRGTG